MYFSFKFELIFVNLSSELISILLFDQKNQMKIMCVLCAKLYFMVSVVPKCCYMFHPFNSNHNQIPRSLAQYKKHRILPENFSFFFLNQPNYYMPDMHKRNTWTYVCIPIRNLALNSS